MATQQIFALFPDVIDAERAIGALEDHGIKREHIGVAARRPAEQDETMRVNHDFVRVSGNPADALALSEARYEALPGTASPAAISQTFTPSSTADTAANVEAVGKGGITTTTAQDSAAGAAVGSGVGLVAGLLGAAAALTIPGFGLILGGGALATAISAAIGTTAAGAVAGSVAGYLRDMGMPEHASDHYSDRMKEGDYLLSVTVDTDQYDSTRQLLLKYNATGVDLDPANFRQPSIAPVIPTSTAPVFSDEPVIVEPIGKSVFRDLTNPGNESRPVAHPQTQTMTDDLDIRTTPIAREHATPGGVGLDGRPLDREDTLDEEEPVRATRL